MLKQIENQFEAVMKIERFKPGEKDYFRRYGGAVFTVLLVLLVSLGINLLLTIIISPLFLAAILFSAWWGGLRAGFVATILSGVLIDYFFVLPLREITFTPDEIIRFLIFMTEGFLFSWLVTSVLQKTEVISNSQARLSDLSLYQQAMLEEERKRISLEIHDELGQALTGLKMDLFLLNNQDKTKIKRNVTIPTEKISELLGRIDITIQTVRKIATELRPPILDDLGLVAAIEWQAHEFEKRTGIACRLKTDLDEINTNPESATAVFRIFQETLTNIIRHSQATAVKVSISLYEQLISLKIQDNGKGITETELSHNLSLGLLGMKERARLINGKIDIVGEKDSGTCVELIFPFEREKVSDKN
jgi:signal transduction histidine kinase